MKSLPAGHHLVQHGAERKDVATSVDLLAFSLLRRHVGNRPKDDALFSGGAVLCTHSCSFIKVTRVGLGQFGETEIQHFDVAVLASDDVGRLQIPMDDSGCM